MKKLLIACLLFPVLSYAAAIPQSSQYDKRMQSVSYNASNTTVIKSKVGFLTTIVFDTGEAVISAKAGFNEGWNANSEDNVVYIFPRPVAQAIDNGEGGTTKRVFQPLVKEWDSNLLVRTTKRIYSFDLVLIGEGDKNQPAYVVQYKYPQEEAKKQREDMLIAQKQVEEENNKKRIAQSFEKANAPKNWDYSMRVNEKYDSRKITPDFAYDNGVFTYLGFNANKTFPAAFAFRNNEEQSLSFNVEVKGKYRVMVLHSVNDKFVLRYGNSVVGIENQSFGKIISSQHNTLSESVERAEIKK
ncbi:TrbG/VirB9 family P-type conjugative transfer protein [Xenorhabdus entomophaga]|uniref:TrbG/VirB9 family P-type conjugative transfer protein n=1 Tax=Xenorhabdus entomophaga TaxID=3136257 RepID=UPI0030F4922A